MIIKHYLIVMRRFSFKEYPYDVNLNCEIWDISKLTRYSMSTLKIMGLYN